MHTELSNDQWAAAFTSSAQRQRLDATAVRDALDEVESHCADSGQSAVDAFGDPRRYAASLALPVARTDWLLGLAIGIISAAVLVGVSSALAYGRGEDYPITVGIAAFGALVLLASPVAFGRLKSATRPASPWRQAATITGLVLSYAILSSLLPGVIWRPSALALLGCIAGLLLAMMASAAIAARLMPGPAQGRAKACLFALALALIVGSIGSATAFGIGLAF